MAKASKKNNSAAPPDRGAGSWLVASFRPVSLFSLRMTHATNKGGKTLTVPTPYAAKMAILEACFRRYPPAGAAARAREVFDWIKWREIRFRPPSHCVVQNTFVKILDHDRDSPLPFKQTIAYREFAFFANDDIGIALAAAGLEESQIRELTLLFAHISSIGKRGSFIQFNGARHIDGDLPPGYTASITEGALTDIHQYGMVQFLDDFGPALCEAKDGFDRVSTYGSGRIELGKHRVLTPTAIPYHRKSAARDFTWYVRSAHPPPES